MKKQLLIIGIIVLFVCGGLSGCNKVSDTVTLEKNKFVGTWKNTTEGFTTTFNLFSNGTCKIQTGNGTWDLKDGKFILTLAINGKPVPYTYAFFNDNRTLSLKQESDVVAFIFTKQ